MKIKFIKVSNYILGVLLTSIGFSSCAEIGTEPSMYGTPKADYEISGKVTNDNNEPIVGISVLHDADYTEGQEAITDKDGNYKLKTETIGIEEIGLTIKDIDGVKNGEFETKQRTETFKKSDFTGGDGSWYHGKATRTVNIKLVEKTTPKE